MNGATSIVICQNVASLIELDGHISMGFILVNVQFGVACKF